MWSPGMIKWSAWLSGPLAFTIVLFIGAPLGEQAHLTAALLAAVVAWWIFQPVPLAVTALLVPVLAVVLGLAEARKAFESFAHPLIFLFMGSFFIAKAVQGQGLDRRLALTILNHQLVSGSPHRSLVAMILVTAFLSMWLSNTATVAMLLPMAIGVAAAVCSDKKQGSFLLPIAYAASIGGTMTPVGSPPNLIAIGFLDELKGVRIGFLEWMLWVAPFALLCLGFLIWLSLRRLPLAHRAASLNFLKEEWNELGPIRSAEKRVLGVVVLTALLWILPSLTSLIFGEASRLSQLLNSHLPESVVAVGMASLLFILPGRVRGSRLLDWKSASQIDWGTLLLFGGGLSLGGIVFSSGLAEILGQYFFSGFLDIPFLFLLVAILFTIFFTEICSNTATANMFIPIVLAVSSSYYLAPALGVALACSLAFMMPIATPPNAIIYGSGKVPLSMMLKKGLLLNLVFAVALSAYLSFF